MEAADVEAPRRARAAPSRAGGGSRAGRSCRRAPGPARRCSGRPRSSTLFARQDGVVEHEVDRLPAASSRARASPCRRRAGRPARRRTTACRSGRGRRCTGPSRRPAARCRGPSPRRRPSVRVCRRKSGRPVSSWPIAMLEVVAGNRLVVGERLGLVARPRLRLGGVDVVLAGPRAVDRRLAVVGDRRVALLVRLHPDDDARPRRAGSRTRPERPPGRVRATPRRRRTTSSRVAKCIAGSVRRRRRISARSAVRRTRSPSVASSSSMRATSSRPIAWISSAASGSDVCSSMSES